jgi:hypothetical protein
LTKDNEQLYFFNTEITTLAKNLYYTQGGKSETSSTSKNFEVRREYMGVHGNTRGVRREYMGVQREYKELQREYEGSTLKKKASHETQEGFMQLKKVS